MKSIKVTWKNYTGEIKERVFSQKGADCFIKMLVGSSLEVLEVVEEMTSLYIVTGLNLQGKEVANFYFLTEEEAIQFQLESNTSHGGCDNESYVNWMILETYLGS